MHPLLSHSPPLLSEQLKSRVNGLRSRIARTNYNTQFAQNAPELAQFRVVGVDETEDEALSRLFQKTVQFTTYDSYVPYIARFFEKPCKQSTVIDLFSPGLPDHLLESSSTSGGLSKWFPRYNHLSQIRSSNIEASMTSDPLRRRTQAFVWYLGFEIMDIEDDADCPKTTIYLTSGSVLGRRITLHLDPEEDGKKMATFILDHAAPYAAGFIKKWQSFLLIHALFALGSRSLETIIVVFMSTFVDMMHHLDAEFDMVVDCIANGTIPDLDGITEVRDYLQTNISPDPARAEELRSLGRPSSRPGWCSHAWPNLRSVTGVASGVFASSVPMVKWFLGPNKDICTLGYASTEAGIATPYNPLESNQFKLITDENIIEFLDISKSVSIDHLSQPWEVELGRRYEIMLTTRDGLWRYRLGDVVEVSGFDPTDGVPVIQFVERRNVVLQFDGLLVSETELRAAISAAFPNTLVKVMEWTAMFDNRLPCATIGFFVELSESGDQVLDLGFAAQHALDALSGLNPLVPLVLADGLFRKPTIRLVRPGTFSDFRQLKLDEGSKNVGQVKTPVVLPNTSYVTWFSDRVVEEL